MAWIYTNAWREVLMRIFDGFAVEYDVSPDWLVNPETKRRLKLDLLYPELGVAVRFQGLQGRERRQRPSLQEEQQQKVRDVARGDVCEAHGITLVEMDVMEGEPKAILRELGMALSNASRRLAKSARTQQEKAALMEQLSQARSRLDEIARRVRRPEDLRLYGDLWQDRQYVEEPRPKPAAANGKVLSYAPGMAVRHAVFGEGVVAAVQPDTNDSLVTVRFAGGVEKTFAASLVGDKLVSAKS